MSFKKDEEKVKQFIKHKRKILAAFFVVAFVLIGTYLIFFSNAATSQTSTTTTNNSANRIGFWPSASSMYYSDADLDRLKSMGVGEIGFPFGYLINQGGTEDWTANPNDPLVGPSHQAQRQIKTSNIIARAHARGIKVVFEQSLSNYYNNETPLCHWMDDTCWNTQALPQFLARTSAMKLLGGDGVYFDGEGYNHSEPVWGWNWTNEPGSATIGKTAIWAAAKKRGNQLMSTMLQGYPGIDLTMYYANFPEGWDAAVQNGINNIQNPYAESLITPFFDGITSAEGYSFIRMADSIFYKVCHLSGCTWDGSNQYNANKLMSLWSRSFSDWNYAASRISVSPMAWIDSDVAAEGAFTAPRGAAYVADQLQKFRKWGMDGEFQIFNYGEPLRGPYDPTFTNAGGWAPYLPGLQAASVKTTVDSQAPSLNITTPAGGAATTNASSMVISGSASDDQALRYVRWTNNRGGTGVAKMDWQVISGDYKVGYNWQMNWTMTSVPIFSGANNITITAVDIHNNTTSQVINVNSGTTQPPPTPPTVSLAVSPAIITQGQSTALTATTSTVAKVEFYDGTTLLNTDTAAPYSFNWVTTASTPAGIHNLSAKAFDAANLSTTSAAINVTVNMADTITVNDTTTGSGVNQFNLVSGTWNSAGFPPEAYLGNSHFTNPSAANNAYTVLFAGTQIKLYSFKYSDLGIWAVSIDGGAETNIDMYSASPVTSAAIYTSPSLASGYHTLKVRNTGTKNANSSATTLVADRIDVTGGSTVTGSPPITDLPGDVNLDGHVTLQDLSVLLGNYGTNFPAADFNKNGNIDLQDLSVLLGNYGT